MRWSPAADPAELGRLAPGAVPGTTSMVGAAAVLTASHLGSLDVANVAVESTIRRLLVAVFIRVSGLHVANLEAWEDRFDELMDAGRLEPAAVTAYTTKWNGRLDLYHPERPFLQDPRLAEECGDAAPPAKLDMTRSSGNSQPWNNRTPQTAPITAHEALWWLLAWRGYGPCGLGANRSHQDVTHKSMAAGPLRAAISWHPATGNEFHNLLLSCPPPDVIPLVGADLPEWEQDTLPDPLRPELPTGPVSRLVNRAAHAILTVPDPNTGQVTGCWVAWRTPVPTAIKTTSGKAALTAAAEAVTGAVDPFLVNRIKGGPTRANHHRAMLRDVDTLIHARRGDDTTGGATLPAWIRLVESLPVDTRDRIGPIRARALACHQDKQEKEELWYASTTPVSIAVCLAGQHPERAAQIARTRQAAEATATALAGALRTAWNAMSPDPRSECVWTGNALAAYWDYAEARFWPAIDDGPDPRFPALALDLYDDATRADAATPTGLIPIATARARLTHPKRTRKATAA
ncbi:type I-E CRISPR-associated protein Cse1/CasA [Streptomyces sp. NPDC059037]|uniref:type I-E CRISPR-associated protein Cse1/CasA n=1 Tax=Streptomyces sp. NPDC059037 TaxID=3346710 RepID=UPI0036A39385